MNAFVRFAADRKYLVTLISSEHVKTIEGFAVLNIEVASFSSFRDIKKNRFVTAAEADIGDSIKRKRIRG